MINKNIFALFFALLLIVPAAYSLTAAIGNAKAYINVNASPEEPAVLERTILVLNRNEIAVKATLKVDEKFEKFVEILDPELTLEPDESKKARYIATIDRGGHFEIKINVAFEPLDPSIKENKVGMASTLIINSAGPIIEEPEEPDEPEEPEEYIPKETQPNAPQNPIFESESNEPEKPVKNTEPKNTESIQTGSAPIIGLIIIIVIVCIGLVAFFMIRKKR